MPDTLQERCERLVQPVTSLAATSLGAAVSPTGIDDALAAARAVKAILDEDASGIEPGGFTDWLPTGRRTVAAMIDALERGDAETSYKLFTDQASGFYRLGIACQGFQGW
ncbi:hypothetical protein [Microbacterium sp. XT11]|uniref:hypothetical protein n=1 Tax=Microbacterium sp. XT11 TaxID=367477 RepID=UPI00082E2B53|nr:hypothetical protein [Microbacterium sp. XT11]